MTNAKKAGSTRASVGNQGMKFNADAIKSAFETCAQNCERVSEVGRENMQAVLDSSVICFKGAEQIHGEVFAYCTTSFDDYFATMNAIASSESIHEVFDLQAEFAKKSFHAHLRQLAKVGRLFADTARDTAAPLQRRGEALVQSAHFAKSSGE